MRFDQRTRRAHRPGGRSTPGLALANGAVTAGRPDLADPASPFGTVDGDVERGLAPTDRDCRGGVPAREGVR